MPAQATIAQRLDDDLVADVETRNPRPDLRYDPAGFVTRDMRKRYVSPDAFDRFVIGRANPAGFDLNHHFAVIFRYGNGHLFERKLIEIVKNGGQHRSHQIVSKLSLTNRRISEQFVCKNV
jgi:hypothetical protein